MFRENSLSCICCIVFMSCWGIVKKAVKWFQCWINLPPTLLESSFETSIDFMESTTPYMVKLNFMFWFNILSQILIKSPVHFRSIQSMDTWIASLKLKALHRSLKCDIKSTAPACPMKLDDTYLVLIILTSHNQTWRSSWTHQKAKSKRPLDSDFFSSELTYGAMPSVAI